jgi:hypothetical protein
MNQEPDSHPRIKTLLNAGRNAVNEFMFSYEREECRVAPRDGRVHNTFDPDSSAVSDIAESDPDDSQKDDSRPFTYAYSCPHLATVSRFALLYLGVPLAEIKDKLDAAYGRTGIEPVHSSTCSSVLSSQLSGYYSIVDYSGKVPMLLTIDIESPERVSPLTGVKELGPPSRSKDTLTLVEMSNGKYLMFNPELRSLFRPEMNELSRSGLKEDFASDFLDPERSFYHTGLSSLSKSGPVFLYRIGVRRTHVDDSGVELDRWEIANDLETLQKDESGLKADLAQLFRRFDKHINELRPVVSGLSGEGFLQSTSEGYRTSDLLRMLEETRADTETALLGRGLWAIVQHTDFAFGNVIAPTTPLVSSNTANQFVHEVELILASLIPLSKDLSVDLRFFTRPLYQTENAKLTITTCETCSELPEIFSQGGLKRLYRGRYQYTVSKPGYKPYSHLMDLIDDPGTAIVCRLVMDQQSGEDSECRLEALGDRSK